MHLCDTDSQIAVQTTTAPTSAFYKLGNDSYKLVTQKMNWEEARRQCQADDGDLASILDPVAQAFVTLMMQKHNESVWIGLNNIVVGLRLGFVGELKQVKERTCSECSFSSRLRESSSGSTTGRCCSPNGAQISQRKTMAVCT